MTIIAVDRVRVNVCRKIYGLVCGGESSGLKIILKGVQRRKIWEGGVSSQWDRFYLINCYRNIYPGCSLSSSHDVFMCFGCVLRRGQGWGGGDDTAGVALGVSGSEVFVVAW